jgi:hypothetical protein
MNRDEEVHLLRVSLKIDDFDSSKVENITSAGGYLDSLENKSGMAKKRLIELLNMKDED